MDSIFVCRMTDLEKPNVVKMVREYDSKIITLAIGDGANDLAMFKHAHVGVGISTVYDS